MLFNENFSIRRLIKWVIKRPMHDSWWALYGPLFSGSLLSKEIESVFFVCDGNICRSPFAEYVARKTAATFSKSLATSSAGLEVTEKNPSPLEAIEAAKIFDIDLSMHLSTTIAIENIQDFDAIFAMEVRQLKRLRKDYPEHREKFFLLPLFSHRTCGNFQRFNKYNIKDPFGRSVDDFVNCYTRIQYCVEALVRGYVNKKNGRFQKDVML